MIVLLVLIALASSQQCPYCEWDACTISSQGLGNCSACSQGALVQLVAGATQADIYGTTFEQTIGVCMLCMTGCSECVYGGFSASMAPLSMGIYCTSCNAGYAYNNLYGNCSTCPANCEVCYCQGDTCWSFPCTTCYSGYTLTNSTCVQDTTSTAALEDSQEKGSSNALMIGLAVWGAVMTVIAGKKHIIQLFSLAFGSRTEGKRALQGYSTQRWRSPVSLADSSKH